MKRYIFLIMFLAFCCNMANASDSKDNGTSKCGDEGLNILSVPPDTSSITENKLRANGVNGIFFKHVVQRRRSSEIDISFRYFLGNYEKYISSDCDKVNKIAYFSYTMKADFFWMLRDTMDSGPVVSRYQNPALHYLFGKVYKPDGQIKRDYLVFDLGVEHISNGQSLRAEDNQTAITYAYNHPDHESSQVILNSISRVNATGAVTGKLSYGFGWKALLFSLSGKGYYRIGQESGIYWGKDANKGINFRKFQIVDLAFTIKNKNKDPTSFSLSTSIGTGGFNRESVDMLFVKPIKKFGLTFPLALLVHLGPMSTMSEYNQRLNSYAVGFAFSY